jgi:flagellar biosynthesis protein FlhG
MASFEPTPDSSLPLPAPPPGVRHVLAVAGARGGAGTSLLAVNLAVYLAQLGRSVVMVDANVQGASLHTLVDAPFPRPRLEEGEVEVDDFVLMNTQIPGLRLLPQAYGFGSTLPIRPGRKPRWAKKLREIDVDYVVLDLGTGTNPSSLDLFTAADLGILVTVPDPPSVEGAYRFSCALFLRRMRKSLLKDRFRLRMLDRAELSLSPLPSPLDLVQALGRFDTALAQMAARELTRVRPRLVMNQARSRADTELGLAMRDMSERYLGVNFDYVGHIEEDDTAWLSVARRRPLLIDSPTSKSARNIERISRRVLALAARKDEARIEPVGLVPIEPTLYDVLLTHRGASDEELRRAFKRLKEIYREGSLPLTSLLHGEGISRAQATIDEANDTLLDSLKRRAYDVSTFPEAEEQPEPHASERDLALAAEREQMREELAHEVNAQTVFTGSLLRKVREAQGIGLDDISRRTKISASYLQAIEEERFAALPAFVYLRGFVNEVAKYLKLDAMQVSRTYLKRYREWRNHQEQAG